ncbi:hypothetical protein [Lewinella sp. 4G2]|uniref:hypothetical protein n=1 Tax=Lewinella sp. 4G2 TaxID=1803372 RepID=UPI0012FBBDAA|nr:hypothetical protein [Lewinella sp. 4G2]
MKYLLVIILLIFAPFKLFSKSLEFSLDSVVLKTENLYYVFPIIISSDKNVENRMNNILQLSELYHSYIPGNKNIFDEIIGIDGGLYGQVKDYEFELVTSNSKIVSIKLDVTKCGMTCNYSTRYYTFDSKIGRRLLLDDLLNKDEKELVIPIIDDYVSHELDNWYCSLASTDLKYENYDLDLIERIRNAIQSMENWSNFYFDSDFLYVDAISLLSKHDRFMGIPTLYKIPIDEFECLLEENSFLIDNNPVTHIQTVNEYWPRIYEGEIDDRYPIKLILGRSYGENFYMAYSYDRYGKGLLFKGKIDSTETIILHQEFIDSTQAEVVNLRIINNRIEGVWKDCNDCTSKNISGTEYY